MAELYIHNNRIESIFQLLGKKENDISYSIGYSFANCECFLESFLRYIGINALFEPEKIKIKLQAHEKDRGFTDFEIIQEGEFYLIIEAKRGWNFPMDNQLDKYASRVNFQSTNAKIKRIIVFNESNDTFTQAHFGKKYIQNILVDVISWNTMKSLAYSSIKAGRIAENRILNDLNTYLEEISTMQKFDSNWVYVVSLSQEKPEDWQLNWRDFVIKKQKYFHPVGGKVGGWPSEPPNYIAFRYDGKLQSIHHIDNYEVFTDPSLHFSEIPKMNWEHHYLYHLGKAIIPTNEVKTGLKIVRSMRVWAMLDLLLTCDTIQEARDKSQERESAYK